MKNKLLFFAITLLFLTATSCKKDLTGNAITIAAETNDTVTQFRLHRSCEPGPDNLPSGNYDILNDLGNGNYHYELEKDYDASCFTITGTIPEDTSNTGVTTLSINIFYTEAGNVVGFKDLELKRPHDEYKISYEFRPDTYLE